MPRWRRLLCLLAVSCSREPSPTAPPSASPAAASTPWVPSPAPSSAPVAVADAAVDAAPPLKPPERPTPALEGRVTRLQPGAKPVVAVDTSSGEVLLRGVDGKGLGWKAGDTVVVHGPAPESGAVDCTEAPRCSVGLKSGGDLALYGVDAHSALELLASFRQNGMVAGRTRTAWLELRATNADVLSRSFAAAFGLGFRRHKSLVLYADPSVLERLKVRHVPVASRKVDLELAGASLQNLTRMLSDVSRASLVGELGGEISVLARNVDSSEPLDAMLALCGIGFERRGPEIVLTQTGRECAGSVSAERHCPPRQGPPLRVLHSQLACIDVKQLELKGLAFPTSTEGPAVALLGAGPPRGDEMAVREGDFLAQSELADRGGAQVEVNWKIADIRREGVDLVLEDPANPSFAPKRVSIPAP